MSGSITCLVAAANDTASRGLEAQAIRIAAQADPAADANGIKRELSRLTRMAKRTMSDAAAVREKLERFNRFFFDEAGFKPEEVRNSAGGLLLHLVLARRQGTCVGLAQVYLVLAQRVGLPVVAAATPTHLLVRWVDGNLRINVELLEGGAEHSDDEYRSQHGIRERDPVNPVFLRDLGSGEVAARIHNNLGVIRSREGLLDAAADSYAAAIELDPRFPAPHYNRGLDRLSAGRAQEAFSDFDAALSIYPADPWALNNQALARLQLGQRLEAIGDLQAALALDPDFPAARKNLEVLGEAGGAAAPEKLLPPDAAPRAAPISEESAGQRP